MSRTHRPHSEAVIELLKDDPALADEYLAVALEEADQPGGQEALLMAPETRTSSPLTIVRDRQLYQSTSHKGLYPCGEGAGYAGGITSAAVDGVRVALAILSQEKLLPPVVP